MQKKEKFNLKSDSKLGHISIFNTVTDETDLTWVILLNYFIVS